MADDGDVDITPLYRPNDKASMVTGTIPLPSDIAPAPITVGEDVTLVPASLL